MLAPPKRAYRTWIGLLLVVICASIFFHIMYEHNNKYTQNVTQAINGLLILTKEDMAKNPYRFLWNGWAYYPDVLLTPEDFENGDPERYVTYTKITTESRMEVLNQKSDGGYSCGTYVLHCKLPKKNASYALDMPEIFSAYRLYVNDKMVLSIGNPEQDSYQDGTANRMATFQTDENGMITILVAVGNQSYYEGGMIYPPAFGTAKSLNFVRGVRLGFCICMLTSLVVALLMSISFWIKIHYRNAFFFSLLCFTMIIWLAYPIIHTWFILPIFPSYPLEMLCSYVTLLLFIILHNRICEIHGAPSILSSLFSAWFCLCAMCYTLLPIQFAAQMTEFFSWSVSAYKIMVAGYLIATTCQIAYKKRRVSPLLYISVLFSCACIWDRIFSEYEPIIGGWFLEWACILLAFTIGFTLWYSLIDNYVHNITLKQDFRHARKQLNMQVSYARQLDEQMEIKRRYIHDSRQHLVTLRSMAETQTSAELLTYLDALIAHTSVPVKTNFQQYCGNPAIDALLNYYVNTMETAGIAVHIQLYLPEQLLLSDIELCTLLGNLLENALEACNRQDAKDEKYVKLKTNATSMTWTMTLENTYDTIVLPGKKLFLTRKSNKEMHGIGLSSVERIAESHHGSLEIMPNKGIFLVGIVIPLNRPNHSNPDF